MKVVGIVVTACSYYTEHFWVSSTFLFQSKQTPGVKLGLSCSKELVSLPQNAMAQFALLSSVMEGTAWCFQWNTFWKHRNKTSFGEIYQS